MIRIRMKGGHCQMEYNIYRILPEKLSCESGIFYIALKQKSVAVFAYPVIFVFQLLASLGPRIVYLDEALFRYLVRREQLY